MKAGCAVDSPNLCLYFAEGAYTIQIANGIVKETGWTASNIAMDQATGMSHGLMIAGDIKLDTVGTNVVS